MDGGTADASSAPLNRETPAAALQSRGLTPTSEFFVRNHFAMPDLNAARWRLQVGGLVRRPQSFGLVDLERLPAHTATCTLECAGNGRALLEPPVAGEQWGLGAVATAGWTGVRLADLLEGSGVRPEAEEILFRGADGIERSLTLEAAGEPPVLLAVAMNGRPLTREHGWPLRVIVPGWYSVADVKWLTEIEVIGHAFQGHFQAEKYVYEQELGGRMVRTPVSRQRVRALITEPQPAAVARTGELAVRGLAWSGSAPIDAVDVSVDGGAWQPARLEAADDPYCWQAWELVIRLPGPGRCTIQARATDAAGNTQPKRADWNRLGYGNNAIQELAIEVLGS
ncbi:MAG: sulfite oxidase [Chloroflexota bacterium]